MWSLEKLVEYDNLLWTMWDLTIDVTHMMDEYNVTIYTVVQETQTNLQVIL